VPVPRKRRRIIPDVALTVHGASANNLKDVTVEIPLARFVCITGVSGSGKSTLVEEVLYRSLMKRLGQPVGAPGACSGIDGAERIADVIMVDQSPLGTTPRANPVSYLKAFDVIRELFAKTPVARLRGYSAATFSFNVAGGRCEACKGEGFEKIEMQFLSDVYVRCPECDATRFRAEILEVTYQKKNIHDVLQLTVREAVAFFAGQEELLRRLQPLIEVGLDYLHLGQALNTLRWHVRARRIRSSCLMNRPSACISPISKSSSRRCSAWSIEAIRWW